MPSDRSSEARCPGMDLTRPDLTVLVVCRDNPGELLQTLDSLVTAGIPQHAEVLVLDSSTEDCCRTVVDKWRRSVAHPWNIQQVGLPPHGVYSAFNHGIEYAAGRWLAFMNSGDGYLPGGMALLLDAAQACGGSLRAVMGQALVCCQSTGYTWLTPDPAMRYPRRWLRHMVPCHQAMLFDRSFARNHPYSESAGAYGDRQVMRAALCDSESFAYVNKPVCRYALDGISSASLPLTDVLHLWRSQALLPSERVGFLLKLLLAPLWRWRPCWMRARSRLMGMLC